MGYACKYAVSDPQKRQSIFLQAPNSAWHRFNTTRTCLAPFPSRKNQRTVSPKKWAQWMRRKRKIVETTFSVLADLFRLTAIRANSVDGFETALDGILLAYTLVVLELVEQ